MSDDGAKLALAFRGLPVRFAAAAELPRSPASPPRSDVEKAAVSPRLRRAFQRKGNARNFRFDLSKSLPCVILS
jgi:hypothetical protein